MESIRGYFPGLEGKVFLDAACISLVPTQSKKAIQKFLDMTLDCKERDASLHHIAMDQMRNKATIESARLLDAKSSEIALIESTTHGLNIAAMSIPFSKEDNVIFADLEFLQVAIPWVKMQEQGLIKEVRMAKNDHGAITTETLARVADSNTKAIIISSVQWCNGYRVDLNKIGSFCKANGIFLVVDAIHQLGAVKLSVKDSHIDILITGGHKWLNSPFGCGFMYINKDTMPKLKQTSWGYLGLENPEGGWGQYFATPTITPLREYRFPKTAKRFEINGTSNYPGAIGIGESLAMINSMGIKNIQDYVFSLTDTVQNELNHLGVEIVTHPGHEVRSGITVFQVSRDPLKNEEFLQKLLDERILLAMRYTSNVGGIRISTHFFNNNNDLDRLFESIKNHL